MTPCSYEGRYFIEACPAALDAPGEWSYTLSTTNVNERTTTIYIYPPNGEDPNVRGVYGKTISYSIVVNEGDGVTVKGIKFFASTLFLWNSVVCVVRDCVFDYPSYSKRSLGMVEQVLANSNPHPHPTAES